MGKVVKKLLPGQSIDKDETQRWVFGPPFLLGELDV